MQELQKAFWKVTHFSESKSLFLKPFNYMAQSTLWLRKNGSTWLNMNDYLFDKSFAKFLEENIIPVIDTNKNKYFVIRKQSPFSFVACQSTLSGANLFLKDDHILVDTSEYYKTF